MCRAFLPPMIERGSGDVINVASVSGKRPLARRTPYCASKMAVLGLTTTLAAEVGPLGITVNSLSPGTGARAAHGPQLPPRGGAPRRDGRGGDGGVRLPGAAAPARRERGGRRRPSSPCCRCPDCTPPTSTCRPGWSPGDVRRLGGRRDERLRGVVVRLPGDDARRCAAAAGLDFVAVDLVAGPADELALRPAGRRRPRLAGLGVVAIAAARRTARRASAPTSSIAARRPRRSRGRPATSTRSPTTTGRDWRSTSRAVVAELLGDFAARRTRRAAPLVLAARACSAAPGCSPTSSPTLADTVSCRPLRIDLDDIGRRRGRERARRGSAALRPRRAFARRHRRPRGVAPRAAPGHPPGPAQQQRPPADPTPSCGVGGAARAHRGRRVRRRSSPSRRRSTSASRGTASLSS